MAVLTPLHDAPAEELAQPSTLQVLRPSKLVAAKATTFTPSVSPVPTVSVSIPLKATIEPPRPTRSLYAPMSVEELIPASEWRAKNARSYPFLNYRPPAFSSGYQKLLVRIPADRAIIEELIVTTPEAEQAARLRGYLDPNDAAVRHLIDTRRKYLGY